MITVTTIYGGASPHEVESSVTKIIEDAVTNVEKIKKVTASSFESMSFVIIEFTQSAESKEALQEVQRRVNEVLSLIPAEAEKPVISKFSLNEMPVLTVAAVSNMEDREFYRFMKEEIKPRISRIEGVGMMSLIGGEEREIKINLDKKKLQNYGLSALEVLESIRKSNFDFPAGKMKDASGQYNVRIKGKIENLNEINNLVLRDLPGSGKIIIRDLAEVTDGTKEIISVSRLNKITALGVIVQRQSGANTVNVCEEVKREFSNIEREYTSQGVKFEIGQDESVFTLQSAKAVNYDLMYAIFLVGITMLIFLHSIRNSIIVMIAIPASLISTFICMYIFNFTLNMMSLLGLSLVIGILVDDSIVVLENIHRHLEMGKDKKTAALVGRHEIGFTALSITLVDVVVFLPLALLSGVVGNLMRQFAAVIVVSTLLSLFVSFTITPMLASRFSKLGRLTKDSLMGKISFWIDEFFKKLSANYAKILSWALNHKSTIIITATVLLFSSFALLPAGFIGAEFISVADKGEISVVLELEPGAKLERTSTISRRMENILLDRPEVTKVFANIGSSEEGFVGQTSNNVAELRVGLLPKEERDQSILELCKVYKDIAREIPGVEARVAPLTMFGTTDMAPVAVGISGANYDEVVKVADKIEIIVKNTPGTSDVRKSTESGKPEMHVEIDRERMAALGLTLDYVGAELRVAINGDNSSKLREGQNEYDIRIAYDEYDTNNPDNLENYSFINSYGNQIYLKQFADVVYASGPSKLERKYRNSSVTVMSMVAGRPSGDIGKDIKKEIDKMVLPAGIKITYENDLEMQDESFGSLGIAFLAAILFVYLILAALYDSFIYPLSVLLTIPLAIIGALFALALTMNSLNIMSLLGMIMLVGLVGKNAILLVDRTNQNRTLGLSVNDALLEAARTRLRPILMTTLTMVFGVLPIAFSSGASNEMKHGLAVVLIGGLTSSLFLTLVLVPVMYVKNEQLREWTIRVIKKLKRTNKEGSYLPSNILSIVFAFTILSSSAMAQELRLSLDDAVALALKNNRQIELSQLEYDKSDQKLNESWGNLLPEISAEGTYIRNTKLPVFYLPSDFFGIPGGGSVPMEIGEKNVYEGYLKFQMPLFNYAIYPGIRAASEENKAMREKTYLTKNEVISEVKKTYYGILATHEQLEVVEKSIDRAIERINDVKSLYNQGLATDVDTLTAFLGIESLKPVRLKMANIISNSLTGLKYLLGQSENEQIVLTDSLVESDDNNLSSIESAYRSSLSQRPEVKILGHQLRAHEEIKNIAKSEYYPSLSAFGQIKIEAQSHDYKFHNYNWPTSSFVGMQLSVPLFSGFKSKARVELAEIDINRTQIEIIDLKASLYNEIQSAHIKVEEALANLATQKSNILLAERNYEIARSRFKNGFSKLSDVLDAELLLREATAGYINELYNLNIATVEFERATGSVLAEKKFDYINNQSNN